MFSKANLLIITSIVFSMSFTNAEEPGLIDSAKAAASKAWTAVSNYATAVGSYKDRWFSGRIDNAGNYIAGAYAGATGDTLSVAEATKRRNEIYATRQKEGKAASDAIEVANTAALDAGKKVGDMASAVSTQFVEKNLILALNDSRNLTNDISSLWIRFNNVDRTMKVMEDQLDRSIMNAYIQQKFARLLSSNNICKAVQSCTDNKGINKAEFNLSDLQDIFPYSGSEIKQGKGTKGTKPASGAPTPPAKSRR